MTDHTTRTASSASAEFARLLAEADDILSRLHFALTNGEWPGGLTWAHAGDMARLVHDLRQISDYVFAEGEHAEHPASAAGYDVPAPPTTPHRMPMDRR